MKNEFDVLFGLLVDNEYFTYDELLLVSCINGDSVDTLNDCIYARYGYQNFEQMEEYDER